MTVKHKRDDIVKGHFCADECKQQGMNTKEQTMSSMVTLGLVLIMAVIQVWEAQDVAVVDLPGAYLGMSMDR